MTAVAGIGSGALARLVGQSSALKARLDDLASQAADGRRGTYYGDFAPDARRAIDLRGAMGRSAAHATALGRALGTTAAAGQALERLSAVAESFLAEAGKVTNADGARITALAGSARQALDEVAGLLNETQAGTYLFGGGDTGRPPIPDPAGLMRTRMATDIAAAVASIAPGNAAAVLSRTLAAAQLSGPGETPFSDYALDPARGGAEARPAVMTGEGETVATGLFAARNAAAPAGGSEAGGWSRDLLRGLMSLSGLTPAMTAAGADFTALMTGIKSGLKAAMTGLGAEAGALGLSEARLESARARHEDVQVALAGQLSAVEEVELAETLTALQDTQTRLQASWQALSMLSRMSLANVL